MPIIIHCIYFVLCCITLYYFAMTRQETFSVPLFAQAMSCCGDTQKRWHINDKRHTNVFYNTCLTMFNDVWRCLPVTAAEETRPQSVYSFSSDEEGAGSPSVVNHVEVHQFGVKTWCHFWCRSKPLSSSSNGLYFLAASAFQHSTANDVPLRRLRKWPRQLATHLEVGKFQFWNLQRSEANSME